MDCTDQRNKFWKIRLPYILGSTPVRDATLGGHMHLAEESE